MNNTDELMLLVRLSEIVSFAETLPRDRLTQRNPEPVYPVTVGELLVNHALGIVLRHEWKVEGNELIVGPLMDALNQLDTGVDRSVVWNKLFEANRKLQEYIDQAGHEGSDDD